MWAYIHEFFLQKYAAMDADQVNKLCARTLTYSLIQDIQFERFELIWYINNKTTLVWNMSSTHM